MLSSKLVEHHRRSLRDRRKRLDEYTVERSTVQHEPSGAGDDDGSQLIRLGWFGNPLFGRRRTRYRFARFEWSEPSGPIYYVPRVTPSTYRYAQAHTQIVLRLSYRRCACATTLLCVFKEPEHAAVTLRWTIYTDLSSRTPSHTSQSP
ncbi:hypothetical protein EVAR_91373_1 [Eumeta japonica]|uniref:Uncharacterized protein n=1 Tax=Eumeta variegata TaxID=151549 RepID=A0A4C1X940_EUMVA|nr:hypothetical protein EVAR_91373_1 [Eumeta japonica]